MEDYTCLMPFNDQSNSFTHGFECGQIWQQMKTNNKFDKYLFHIKNKEQVEMMCRRFLYTHSIEIIDDTWCYLTAQLNLAMAN